MDKLQKSSEWDRNDELKSANDDSIGADDKIEDAMP